MQVAGEPNSAAVRATGVRKDAAVARRGLPGGRHVVRSQPFRHQRQIPWQSRRAAAAHGFQAGAPYGAFRHLH